MPAGGDKPGSPVSPGIYPGLSHDARTDSGYGVSKEKFHAQRQKSPAFPYDSMEEDTTGFEVDLDYDQLVRVFNKIGTPFKSSDFLIGRSADHSTFSNGNRPVALGESASLVPFPGMYKKRVQAGGGVNSPKLVSPGQYNRSGTHRGWSHAHVPIDPADTREKDDLTPEEQGLEKIRNLVRNVLKANSREL